MAKTLVTIAQTDLVKAAVADFVSKRRFPKLIDQAKDIAKPKLILSIVEAFRRTLFYKGMAGEYAGDRQRDVQAHLGLGGGDAIESLNEMESAIESSLEVKQIIGLSNAGTFSKLGSSAQIVFNIGSPGLIRNIKERVSSPSYTAKTGTVVDWLHWVLEGGGSVDMAISFNPYAIALRHGSRTGRAVMVWSSVYGWNIDDYNRFSESGVNFIEDMMEDQALSKEMEDIIIASVTEANNA